MEKRRGQNWRNPGFSQDDRHPVVCVSWNDSKAFTDWLKGKTGRELSPSYGGGMEYRLEAGAKL